MREELEEGHFDTEGMYIFKKDQVGTGVRSTILSSVNFHPTRCFNTTSYLPAFMFLFRIKFEMSGWII